MIMPKKQKGFTLIELLIVIAIIGILSAIAIPIFQMKLYRAKLTEVTNSMGYLASALGAYLQYHGSWPANTLRNPTEIQNTLGVAIPIGTRYIRSVTITGGTGVINVAIQNTGNPVVDAGSLVLAPAGSSSEGVVWSWSASPGFPEILIPKQ